MKNLIVSFIVVVICFFCCGCTNKRPFIIFNNQPITRETVNYPVNTFELGETTHYILVVPKGFKQAYLRAQIVKKDTGTQSLGYSLYRSQSVKVDRTNRYYISSVKIAQPGTYILSFFYLNKLNTPFIQGAFVVK